MRGEITTIVGRVSTIRIDSRSYVVEPRGPAPTRTRSVLFMHRSHGALERMKPNTAVPANSRCRAIVFGCLVISAAALTPARAQNVSDQFNKYGCVACHAVDQK